MNTGGDYVTDVPYINAFHREMTPVWLSTTAIATGHAPPDITRPYTWCELGCGGGAALVLTAAANPLGRFIGIDFNAAHIQRARDLAAAANIKNVQFVAADFAEAAVWPPGRIPQQDFIVLHGVYSWISPDLRTAIQGFINRFLAPGGLVYLHYMTHPGMSSFAAGQHLLQRYASTLPGASDRKVHDALELLRQLNAADAGYFVAHPEERRRLHNARRESPFYLAHEFLTANWTPLHVADVIQALAELGCTYVGSASIDENIDAVSLPARIPALFPRNIDVTVAETIRDIARNQTMRRDIYQRDVCRLSPAEHLEQLARIILLALPQAPTGGGLRFETRIGPVDGAAEIFSPLLAALAQGALAFVAALKLPIFAAQPHVLNQAFQMLIWAGYAHPRRPDRTQSAPAPAVILSDPAGATRYVAMPSMGTALPSSEGA